MQPEKLRKNQQNLLDTENESQNIGSIIPTAIQLGTYHAQASCAE